MLRALLLGVGFSVACVNGPELPPRQERLVEFKSDADPRYAFLEKQQIDSAQCTPTRSKEATIALLTKALEQDCRTPGYAWGCRDAYVGLETVRRRLLNTRCEDAAVQFSWGFFADNLVEELQRATPPISAPPWATWRTGQMNGMAIRIHGTDYAVLLNRDLDEFHFNVVRFLLNLLEVQIDSSSRRVTMAYSIETVRRLLAQEPEYAAYFASLFTNAVKGIELPTPLSAPFTNHEGRLLRHTMESSAEHQRLLASIHKSGIDFVVAHEYAHAFLGHERSDWQSELTGADKQTQIEVADNSDRSNELAADRYGYQMLLEHQPSLDPSLWQFFVQGPEIFMVSLRLLELERKRLGVATLDTHPPAEVRQKALANERRRLGGVAEKPDSDDTLATVLSEIAAFAWADANGLCIGDDMRFRELCQIGMATPNQQARQRNPTR